MSTELFFESSKRSVIAPLTPESPPVVVQSRLFKGLQAAGIILAQTGQTFTVNGAFDINQDGNLTDRLNCTNGE